MNRKQKSNYDVIKTFFQIQDKSTFELNWIHEEKIIIKNKKKAKDWKWKEKFIQKIENIWEIHLTNHI